MKKVMILFNIILLTQFQAIRSSYAQIIEHPKSKLVPLGVKVTFKCKVLNGVEPHWVLNNRSILLTDHLSVASSNGFFITNNEKNGITSLTLQMNATPDKNGTEAYCKSLPSTRSNIAILLIITESPVSLNPSISNMNATSILVKWSPPFLWPGSTIAYYNISVTNMKGHSDYYHVNTSFSDAVVSFVLVANQSQTIESCDRLRFEISPITIDDSIMTLKCLVITGGFIPNNIAIDSTSAKFMSSLFDLNITVLFTMNQQPVVNIKIDVNQLICSYQEFNYSIIIESNIIKTQTVIGPFKQIGHDAISEMITYFYEEGMEYNLTVVLNTIVGTITSHKHNLSTRISQNQVNPTLASNSTYKLMIISSCMTVIIFLLSLALVVTCLYLCCHTSGIVYRIDNNNTTIQHAMVCNPIYDGPVYESVLHPHFENLTSATSNNTANSHVLCVEPDIDHRETSDSPHACYIEQLPNQALKPQSESGSLRIYPIEASDNMEDKYTVMSPAGTVNASSL